MKETVCLTCGDRGFTEAFIYCVKCLNFAVHRYCLYVLPKTADEFVYWVCDDCKFKVKSQLSTHACDYSPSEVKENKVKVEPFGSDTDPGYLDYPTFSADAPKDVEVAAVGPVAKPIWRGCFNMLNKKYEILNEVVAHISSKACKLVHDVASQCEPMLQFELLPKSEMWPKSFQESEPSGENIALYFFPTEISERDFDILVEKLMNEELGLKAVVQNAELLVFSSTELPPCYWTLQDFRGNITYGGYLEESENPVTIDLNAHDIGWWESSELWFTSSNLLYYHNPRS